MKFSRKTDYGVILVEALRPSFKTGEFISLRLVSKENNISLLFLGKLAEILRLHGYLEARRGQKGGYRLIRDPKNITLKELVDVFEEPPLMKCMKSPHPMKHCPLVKMCQTRRTWLKVEDKIKNVLENVTLAEF